MDILGSVPLLGPILTTILPFLITLSIIVAVHEYGHLLAGRLCGIRAEVFSVGFGKVLWSRVDKHGTRWQFAVLPLGGYVKFLGDMDPASAGRTDDADLAPEDRPHAFHNASLWRRAVTVLAGPVANFLLSMVIFFGLAISGNKASDEPVVARVTAERPNDVTGLVAGDRVLEVDGVATATFGEVLDLLARSNGVPVPVLVERGDETREIDVRYVSPPVITSVVADGAALGGGMRPGDRFVSVSGEPVETARDVQLAIAELEPGEPVRFGLLREGRELELTITPKLRETMHPVTGESRVMPFLGIGMQQTGIAPTTVPTTMRDAVRVSVLHVWQIVSDTVLYMKEMIFFGADTSQLSGPIGIAKHSANAASEGWMSFMYFVAFISTAIGLLNLFPIPVLDGGHLMFYLAEAIRGRPNSETVVRYGTMMGLSLLLLLMVYVTFNNDLGLGAWFNQL